VGEKISKSSAQKQYTFILKPYATHSTQFCRQNYLIFNKIINFQLYSFFCELCTRGVH